MDCLEIWIFSLTEGNVEGMARTVNWIPDILKRYSDDDSFSLVLKLTLYLGLVYLNQQPPLGRFHTPRHTFEFNNLCTMFLLIMLKIYLQLYQMWTAFYACA